MKMVSTKTHSNETTRFIDLEDHYGAHNYHPLDVVITRGDGVWVYDVEDRKYLDCLSAYSAVNQGHCHPHILNSMMQQAKRLTLTSRAFYNDQLGPFYKELCEFGGYEMALPMNTGAEAVETAIKAARKWGYTVKGVPADQAEIIVCDGNFHGVPPPSSAFHPSASTKRVLDPSPLDSSPFPSATPMP